MNIQYQQLCKIEFKHSYYADGVLKEFNLDTPSATQNKMRRDILIRQTQDAVLLYADQDKKMEATKLHFSINLQNPYFFAFTEISLDTRADGKSIRVAGEKKYFFSNENAVEGVISIEVGSLVSTRFEVRFIMENEGAKKLELLDTEGNIVYEELIETADMEVGQEKTHLVDVSENLPSSGIYQLVFDGEKIGKVFITSAVQEYSGMGVLEIDTSKGADYSIQLESRRVYFRYNLILNDDQKNVAFSIKANDGQTVAYEQQEEKTLSNGQATTPILIKEKIALAERPARMFSLEVEALGNTTSIPLPFADPTAIKRLETSTQNEAYIAELYVYI